MLPNVCRLLVDPQPGSGGWNMAVDEALLESALQHGTCALRWYRWREPTVSLGYFQPADEIGPGSRFAGLAQVRRLSGGGAILHDQELTYSCVLPPNHPLSEEPVRLYDVIHEQVIAVLARYGIAAAMRGEKQSGAEPFLCFGRGDPRDIVLSGQKILGSAQRRRRGAVLQHGSLLLRRSPHAPEFAGLFDLADPADVSPSAEELLAELLRVPPAGLAARLVAGGLTADEVRRSAELVQEIAARWDRAAINPLQT